MESIAPVLEVIRTLRGENGCPWDRVQTPETLWKCLAEELYELEEGLAKNDLNNICEELGDILFLVLFVMEILHTSGKIPFSRVVDTVTRKMIRRHPHVYGESTIADEHELYRQWDRIKAEEKAKEKEQVPNGAPLSALDNVPRGMPGLLRAMKVSKAAVKEGFDWDNMGGVLGQVSEEIREFEEASKTGTREDAMLEFGDILFSLVNVARFAGFHPEMALQQSTAKFEKRFRLMEEMIQKEGLILKSLSQEEKERFWNRAKQEISQSENCQ